MTGPTEKKKWSNQKSSARDKNQDDQSFANSIIVKAFEGYSAELAAKHDKYERIVKLSRDVTIASKRVIYSIHALTRSSNFDQDVQKIKQSFKSMEETLLKGIAKELENEDHYQYIRAYFYGVQEYIEALTFFHYVTAGTLFNYDNVIENLKYQIEDVLDTKNGGDNCQVSNVSSNENSNIVSGEPEGADPEVEGEAQKRMEKTLTLSVEVTDYILGVQDLTGELMRYCISSFAANRRNVGYSACDFVRRLYSAMILLSNVPSREFSKKFEVSRQSLEKMEMACYNTNVRGSEALAFQADQAQQGFEPFSLYD